MRFHLVLLLTLLCAIPATAGVLIVEETRQPNQQTADTSRVRVESDRVRVESVDDGKQQVFIYRGDQETFYMIDVSEGTYRQFSKADFERMTNQLGNQMTEMQRMMQEKLKDMPPEQRQMVERMMKNRMGSMPSAQPAAVQTVYKKVASGERVRQWRCDRYEGYRNGEKVSDVCAANWEEMGVSADDFRVFENMVSMFQRLSSRLGVDISPMGPGQDKGGYDGVPVRRISYRNGQLLRTSEVVEVSRQRFDPALFEVPAGMRRLETPEF